MHKDNSSHKELCMIYSLSIKMEVDKKQDQKISATIKLQFYEKTNDNLPASMESFFDTYVHLEDKIPDFKIFNVQKIRISEDLSMPLTLLYLLQKLNFCAKESLAIHVFNASEMKNENVGFWCILKSIRSIKKVSITFFDLAFSKSSVNSATGLVFSKNSFIGEKFYKRLRADDYVEMCSKENPDIVVGFNLNIHEREYGTSESSWEDTFCILRRTNIPIVITGESEERARKDHDSFCQILDKNLDYDLCEENPYSSLIPKRDFESEGLRYSNKYITIYKNICESEIKIKSTRESSLESIEDKTALVGIEKLELKTESETENGEAEEMKPVGIEKLELKTESETENGEAEEMKPVEIEKLELETESETENGEAEEIEPVEIEKLELKTESETENGEAEEIKPVEIENFSFETELETEKSPEAEIKNDQSKMSKKLDHEQQSEPDKNELFNENSLLKNVNRLLKKNLELREQNKQTERENLKLKVDNERLKREHELIKNLRQQVQESIHSAMNKKS